MTEPNVHPRVAFGWEVGAAFFLLLAGLAMMLIPTLGLFTHIWTITASSLGIYVAALIAGGGLMVGGGILAAIAGQSARREAVFAHQASIDKTKRVNDLAERMSQVTSAVNTMRTELADKLSDLQETVKESAPAPAGTNAVDKSKHP